MSDGHAKAPQAHAQSLHLHWPPPDPQVMPNGFELGAVQSPAEVPEVDLNGWFWLSVSESVRGQAILALVGAAEHVDLLPWGC